jgi:exopolysaccharide biosynthesis polyprenyl glycosylphosphotransferase
VASELSADLWSAGSEQTLTRVRDRPRGVSEGVLPARLQNGIEPDPRLQPVTSRSPSITRKSTGLRRRLFLVDVIAVVGTWLLLGTIDMRAVPATVRWGAALAAVATTLAIMYLLGLYRSRLCVQRGQEAARIVVAILAGVVVLELLRGDADRNYGAVTAAAVCGVLALIVLRWAYGQWLRARRAAGDYHRGLVMVGANEDAAAVCTMLESEPELGYEVRGIIGDLGSQPDGARLPHATDIEQLPEMAEQTDASGVLLVANALSAAEVHRVIELATTNRLHVQVWPGFRGLGASRVRCLPVSGETFLYVEPGRRSKRGVAGKRAIDLVGAGVGLLVSMPVLLVAWAAIRLQGGGPVLYRQVRIGLDQRPFVLYKLRTMAVGAGDLVDLAPMNERTDGPLFKAASDPRVTRVGSVLRALSIDEIPQLFNVLTGTMSLVGPRPALPHEVAEFDPELQRRHTVKPGITGLWQLEARDNPSFHAYRRLDLFYVDNWSNRLDAFILLATLPMVITRALAACRRDQISPEARSEVA